MINMNIWREYGFYLMIGLFILLYISAMISGFPNKSDMISYNYDYTELFIGDIMQKLFITPMFILIPLGLIASIYSHFLPCDNKQEYSVSEHTFIFSYTIITLLSSILFFIISQKLFFDEYSTTGWLYLSSGVVLFIAIFIRNINSQ